VIRSRPEGELVSQHESGSGIAIDGAQGQGAHRQIGKCGIALATQTQGAGYGGGGITVLGGNPFRAIDYGDAASQFEQFGFPLGIEFCAAENAPPG
jgi:hypothetical protein